MENVLVTGGAGFLGSHLAGELLRSGRRVVCLDNLSTGSEKNIKILSKYECFRFIKGDVVADNLENLFEKESFDYVFHYAAVVGVKRTLENPLSVLRDAEGVKNILELSRRYGVKKVVHASSSEVYGQPVEIPETENGHVNPKLPYAVVKIMGEKYMEAYHYTYGLKACSLRLFNVYGPRQDSSDYGFVVGIFIRQVLQDQPPTIFGDGSQTRDFVYVSDSIGGAIAAAMTDKSDGEVINIGTGQPITVLRLAEEIIDLCGKGGKLEPRFVSQREKDVKHRFPDITKMRVLLGFRPSVSLRQGLKQTIEYYRNLK